MWGRGAAARAARQVQLERTERALSRLHRGLQRQFALTGLRDDPGVSEPDSAGHTGTFPDRQQPGAGDISPGHPDNPNTGPLSQEMAAASGNNTR